MKIAVLVKRVPDTASVFKIAVDGKSVETANLKYVMSPYDEHAVEEAIKLKEKNGGEVIIVSVGPSEAKEIIRSGLAMGADSGLLITGAEALSPRGLAKVLAAALKTLAPDVIFAGKQAVDDDAAQVPERVAELLDMPHASVITRFECLGASVVVDREIEGGQYTLELPLPALLTTQKGINTPRYPTLPNIMKAKKKEIREMSVGELGLASEALAAGCTVEAFTLPRQERLRKVLEGESIQKVQELVRILRETEKVL
ncbi:MAG TPA: electron transfer flavoprotein subunit beta/FixA family protein [Candidatus Hydrogenedentes bacterium]|nr:electron transfer flavoprotein subunit beta/FixA family protein [Candidatus Hydrogenedentota bacterium]